MKAMEPQNRIQYSKFPLSRVQGVEGRSPNRRCAAQAFDSSVTGLTIDRQTHTTYRFEQLAAVNASWPLWCASLCML
jgi:hypothetical protein